MLNHILKLGVIKKAFLFEYLQNLCERRGHHGLCLKPGRAVRKQNSEEPTYIGNKYLR